MSKAEFGLHSGSTGACCISRMVRSARRTRPRMGWVRARSPVFDSIADGALWAATEGGGLSRIKDGRIATLTSKNGLPCDTIHWTIEDDDRSLWLYTACGLVRITRSELDAWIADPNHSVQTTLWDAADGVILRRDFAWFLRSSLSRRPPMASCGSIRETVSKSSIHVMLLSTNSRRRYTSSKSSPTARFNGRIGLEQSASNLRLPARTRDLQIDYTALSLVAPEKVHFKYMLEGQDSDWREVVNDRQAAVLEPSSPSLPLSRDREQQQRGVERAGRYAGVLHRPGVLPDELVPRAVRGRCSWHCCGRLTSCACGNCSSSST